MIKRFVFFIGLFSSGLSVAQEKIYIQTPASFIEGEAVRESVKEQCGLETYLSTQTLFVMARDNENAAVLSSLNMTPTEDAVLIGITITEVRGRGGNAYSGRKKLTVRADYKVGARILASKTFTAISAGGILWMTKGICGILENDADEIAGNISDWIKQLPDKQKLANAYVAKPNAPGINAQPVPVLMKKEIIYLISPVERLDSNNARLSTKDECGLPIFSESAILDATNSIRYPIKSLSPYKRKGVAMNVSIIDAMVGGQKTIKMRVDLLRDGDFVASKNFEPQSTDSIAFGSCQSSEKLIHYFSAQSVQWVIEQTAH